MGCCASRPQTTSSNAAHPPPTTPSSRHITAPSTRSPSPTTTNQRLPQPAPSASIPDPANRPNAALRPISPDARSKLPTTLADTAKARVRPLTHAEGAWTRARLETERKDWWDTRVVGNSEVWAALRIAAGNLSAGDVASAQALLDAVGATCPSGVLWKGVYDEAGVLYKVPEWVVVEPGGLVEEDDADESEDGGIDLGSDAEVGEEVMIMIRVSDGRDVRFVVGERESVGAIVAKVKVKAKIPDNTRVRLVYGGRPYRDSEALTAHPFWSFESGHLLVALVLD